MAEREQDLIKNQNVCVIGGCGFIGSNIAEELCINNKVRVIDNLYSGNTKNIEHFKDKVEYIQKDIREKDVDSVLKDTDIIFHTGANAFIDKSIENPGYDAEVNIIGTINLLEACRKNDIKKIVLSSTSAVYGEPVYQPIDEKHPVNPDSPYAISKRSCELYMQLYKELYGIKAVNLRYFNIYGNRQATNAGVISIFIDRILRNQMLCIFGNGTQTRDYVHVSDAVKANILAVTQHGVAGKIFNIGTGKCYSINDLIEILKKINPNVKAVYKEKRLGDPLDSVADTSLSEKELGFKYSVEFETGVKDTYGYMKKYYNYPSQHI
ncbi:MAG: GDP-mannose 4,6-dehydratase [Candidatus Nanoarchaeia archaeon]|nr:GDP-mannose 4,6-dehydratase [Candidatus Nanoarchaeia archaeon]